MILAGGPAGAAGDSAFPEARPHTRAEALEWLAGDGPAPLVSGRLRQMANSAAPSRDPAARMALALLLRPPVLADERVWISTDGVPVRFSPSGTFDRAAPSDADRDGIPDGVEAVGVGLSQARRVLVERLRFSAPDLEVVLAGLGGSEVGYVAPVGRDDRLRMVLEAAPAAGADASRRLAVLQYAHAVALGIGGRLPGGWAEALAHWTLLEVDGSLPDGATLGLLNRRVNELGRGLVGADLELAAGNALWLSFLNEIHGPAAVRLTVEEVARTGAGAAALDRALRASTDQDLDSAFREFQLWALLTGPFADRDHFPFAARLDPPEFASTHPGLPALSVHSDPPVAPWGAAQVLIRPDVREGGLRLRFEGEFGARWRADLLLVRADRELERVSIDVTDGAGEVAVPVQNVDEVILLVRHAGGIDPEPRRYTYAAHADRGYPFELTSVDVVAGVADEGIAVSWETASEQGLAGFNVLRSRGDGGSETVVNAIPIPSLGDASSPTSYFFIDQSAEAGVTYRYRIQGLTREGLTSASEPIVVRRPAAGL